MTSVESTSPLVQTPPALASHVVSHIPHDDLCYIVLFLDEFISRRDCSEVDRIEQFLEGMAEIGGFFGRWQDGRGDGQPDLLKDFIGSFQGDPNWLQIGDGLQRLIGDPSKIKFVIAELKRMLPRFGDDVGQQKLRKDLDQAIQVWETLMAIREKGVQDPDRDFMLLSSIVVQKYFKFEYDFSEQVQRYYREKYNSSTVEFFLLQDLQSWSGCKDCSGQDGKIFDELGTQIDGFIGFLEQKKVNLHDRAQQLSRKKKEPTDPVLRQQQTKLVKKIGDIDTAIAGLRKHKKEIAAIKKSPALISRVPAAFMVHRIERTLKPLEKHKNDSIAFRVREFVSDLWKKVRHFGSDGALRNGEFSTNQTVASLMNKIGWFKSNRLNKPMTEEQRKVKRREERIAILTASKM